MVYCDHCDDNCPSLKDPDKGFICCRTCGKVLDDTVFSDEPNFYKDSQGQSHFAGRVFESIESEYSISHKRTLDKARDEISQIVNNLHVGGGDTIIKKAHHFYEIALDCGFTKGRRTTHVAAACLYIACRQSKKAYLLIDFSDYLQISVYVLGAVFLQLCQVLLLAEHPVIQKLIDPSLFIHRFTACLLRGRDNAVSNTALRNVSDTAVRIVASMKRDWMQTGRKPSGLCGAALYIAALSHGYNYTKVSVVHVCEATLMKRLIEFENTDSGSLTIEEFLATTDEYNQEPVSKRSPMSGKMLCKHKKDKDVEHFAHGLCEKCYNKFIKLSSGLEGGADPPAFQQAEKQRFEAAKRAEEEAAVEELLCDTQNSDFENTLTPREVIASVQRNAHTMGIRGDKSSTIASKELNDSVLSKDPEEGGENCEGDVDPDSLSDINDVDWYIHNEEETQCKKIIWEEMNREYLQEQAAKEALAAELAARGVVQEAKKKRRRNEDIKSSEPAETPAQATYNMLKRKGYGSKVSEEALGELYKTLDEDGSTNKKGEMDFEARYGLNNADGETFDHGYDNYDGYEDDGAGAYDGFDDFDF